MDFAQIFETWKAMMAAGEDLPWWQDFYVKFYQAFIEAGRWQEYLQGVGVTLVATALALLMGVILGVAVSMVRTAHDQQRPGRRKNPALGVVNAVFKVYVTVIRGTPMMLQLLIWAFVVFKSRQYTLVGIFGLGINSGAYVSEIIRGGLMAVEGTVAVDPEVIPYGSRLYIVSSDGSFVYGYAVAADTGTAIMDGIIDVDLFYDTYLESLLNGLRTVNIYVLE